MLKHHFILLYRDLTKGKFLTALTILGLSLGMTCFILLTQFVLYELSYDKFHEQEESIYRLKTTIYEGSHPKLSLAQSPYPLAQALKANIPEIKEIVRIRRAEDYIISNNRVSFNAKGIQADSTFLNVFTYKLKSGSASEALNKPNSIVISEDLSSKVFGGTDPIGRSITVSYRQFKEDYIVTGILENIPQNSHLEFEFVLSLNLQEVNYHWFNHIAYLVLNSNADIEQVEEKIIPITRDISAIADNYRFSLQPLGSIYLHSNIQYDNKSGSYVTVIFMLVSALLIMLVSLVNYINIAVARAMERAKEVGIRKILGNTRFKLFAQFIIEAFVYNLIPILLTLLLVFVANDRFSELTGKVFSIIDFSNPTLYINIALLYIACSILSGLYPAFIVSSFKTVSMLSGAKLTNTRNGISLKQGLLVFQFAASIFFIIFAASIYEQVGFMQRQDKGISLNNIIAVRMPQLPSDSVFIKSKSIFQTELENLSSVDLVSNSNVLPGTKSPFGATLWRPDDGADGERSRVMYSIHLVNYDYFEMYNIEFIGGRGFSREFRTDNNTVVINESALRTLGFESAYLPVGQELYFAVDNRKYTVIGVIKDYNQQSLKQSVDPMVFFLTTTPSEFFSIKMSHEAQYDDLISQVYDKWNELFSPMPFDAFLVNEHYNNQYNDDVLLGKNIASFSFIIIIITILGVLSMSIHTLVQKTKEIGVRKVLGASISDVLFLITLKHLQFIMLASVVSWAVAYWAVSIWLENFASRISIPIWSFIAATLLVSLVTIVSIAYHTISAARRDPVESIRCE